jgi:hypothetical protein
MQKYAIAFLLGFLSSLLFVAIIEIIMHPWLFIAIGCILTVVIVFWCLDCND